MTTEIMPDQAFHLRDYQFVQTQLIAKLEIAFLDVREEAPHAEGHPLFAANLPSSRIELDAYTKLPRKSVPIVIIDSGEGLAELSAKKLTAMGFQDVGVFDGGIDAWSESGGELFIDVNVPSKSFGELLESKCHTPSLPAEEVKKLIESDEDVVVLDVRRFDEYKTMSIPTGMNVPGAELVLRVADIAPNSETKIIVNCAGRTRSLIGTQSLINAGLPNPINALRNGTIGWTLANQTLDTGKTQRFPKTSKSGLTIAQTRARKVADNAGVKRASSNDLAGWAQQIDRSTYFFDVRSFAEYEKGHIEGFYWIEGGQLVQETEMYAPTRGARIVVVDDDGARANMSASWLAQMAWDVYVLDNTSHDDFTETGAWSSRYAKYTAQKEISVEELLVLRDTPNTVAVLDFSKHATYVKGHIPGAHYVLRSTLESSISKLPSASTYVLTADTSELLHFIAPELTNLLDTRILVLSKGTQAWLDAGLELETGETHLVSTPIDRYKRPYEGTAVSHKAMQAYLDWEFGLVEQLARDGTHHFQPRNLKL